MKKSMKFSAFCVLIFSFSFLLIANPLASSSTKNESSEIRTIKPKKRANYNVRLQTDVSFYKLGNKELKLHLLIPDEHKSKPKPLIIFIKGSSWGKYKPQDSFAFIPQLVQFAKSGYVVASIEHRTSHEAKFPAQVQDVKAAVVFLKEKASEYQINPDLVGVWGTSSGAHLAALVGTSCHVSEFEGSKHTSNYNSCVQAVVDWYGPTDFLQMSKASKDYNAEDPESAESLLIGGPLLKNKDKVSKANPITYVSSETPPFLIMHGDRDKRVPFNQSQLLYEALKKENVDVTLYKVKGGGHGGGFSTPEIIDIVHAFFDKHLKP
ncbi:prolyl oligopeptidase family serine peptidase [Mesobacillus maritimus]|uniref:prolyl oligopeptidase family serine peptidase n=1 Tax=Mesobacillus maritimus TaxID=1643336 RepID=UPI00384D8BE4